MNRKKRLGLVILILLIAAAIILITRENEHEKKKEIELNSKEKGSIVATDDLAMLELDKDFQKQYYGETTESVRVNDGYLSVTKSGQLEYGGEFSGDRLIWSKKEKKGFTHTLLLDNARWVNVVSFGEKDYFPDGENKIVVAYESNDFRHASYNSKGYVYRIKADGDLEKLYETKNDFYEVYLDEKNALFLVEKQFDDALGKYPTAYKPYVLTYYKFTNDGFTQVKGEKKVTPKTNAITNP